jgi:tetratricopeptide (TPR) repeat protein/DNA-binding XRE family transcriptional regulator
MQENEYAVHPMRVARIEQGLTQDDLAQVTGLGVSTIRRAEQWFPLNIKTQRILSDHFKKTPKELGLLGRSWAQNTGKVISASQTTLNPSTNLQVEDAPAPLLYRAAPSSQYTPTQAIDLLAAQPNIVTDQHAGAWLALGTSHLAQLFDEGWSLENILNSLRVVMQGAQGIPAITRRSLLQLSGAAMVSGITLPIGEHVSIDERVKLTNTLSKNIADGWTLFHKSKLNVSQVIAVAQAQLALIKEVEPLISPVDRSLFFSAIYRIIGTGLAFQGRYAESLRYNHSAHMAALESGHLSSTIQSLLCIVNSYHELKQYADATQTIDIAFRLSEHQTDVVPVCSKAHILGCWADNAILQGENVLAQKKLDEAAAYLDQISPNEEFDRAAWLTLQGKHAFTMRDYSTSIRYYEKALLELLPSWTIGKIIALIPLMVAYAYKRERDKGLATAQNTLEMLQMLNSPVMSKLFIDSVEQVLLATFPHDKQIQTFLTDVRHL